MYSRNSGLVALAASFFVGLAGAQQPLNVCMAMDNSPLSYRAEGEIRGLDLRVAQAIAAELQRPLHVIPFESDFDAGGSLTHEVNALLSSGVCELASGFPLVSSDLGAPSRPTARVPEYPGAKRPPQRAWVPLGSLVASRAYHAAAWGLVVRDAARESSTLADAGDARIGASAGTMTGSIISMFQNGRLRKQVVSLSRNENPLEQLDAGKFDMTLVGIDRFDAWQIAHPGSLLRRTSYLHPLRINIGFVARSDAPVAIAAANLVIGRALADGDLSRWAAAAGSSWITPGSPEISEPIGMAELMRE